MGAPSELRRRLFTVEEFYRMAKGGIFHDNGRIELFEGELIEMPPAGPDHAHVLALLDRAFQKQTDDSAIVYVQSPIALPPRNALLPDLLVSRSSAILSSEYPGVGQALLVVEVSDTSMWYDRGAKLRNYANHRVSECWIVDVESEQIVVHRKPEADGYRVTQVVGKAGRVSPQLLPEVVIDVSKIFPESPIE